MNESFRQIKVYQAHEMFYSFTSTYFLDNASECIILNLYSLLIGSVKVSITNFHRNLPCSNPDQGW